MFYICSGSLLIRGNRYDVLYYFKTIRGIVMEKGITEVYCGTGKGQTTLAIGQSLKAALEGQSVIVIQFLKGNERQSLDFLQNL